MAVCFLDDIKLFQQKSIAVLPFESISSDPENEYFADGMTEEIINALSKIDGLKVTARTSSFVFKSRREDIRIIGNELGVSTVLEGSIRKSGERIRITTQLIRTDNGFQLWSEVFDRQMSDIFALQDEISVLIGEKIRENFGHISISDHLIEAPTKNIEAYNLYLKARYYHLKWDGDRIERAVELYKQCINMDPDFSTPYFGIGFCYTMLGSWGLDRSLLKLAEDYLEKGLALDQDAAYGYFAMGALRFWGDWDFKAGYENYAKAIAINPNFTEAEEALSELFLAIGDFDQAMKHIENALRINPLSANHIYTKGNILFYQGKYKESLKYSLESIGIDLTFLHAIKEALLSYLFLDEKEKYVELLGKYKDHPFHDVFSELFRIKYDTPKEDEFSQIIDTIDKRIEGLILWPWKFYFMGMFGKMEEALEVIREEAARHSGQYIFFRHFPFESVKKLPAFQQLVEAVFDADRMPGKAGTARKIIDERAPLTEEEASEYLGKLNQCMAERDPFKNQELNLRSLADEIHLHPNKLSWLLNQSLGKNFNDYVNGYRLEAFKKMALDPVNKHLTLLGLAYDAGFKSKSTFNDYFRKQEGVTPKEWVRQNK